MFDFRFFESPDVGFFFFRFSFFLYSLIFQDFLFFCPEPTPRWMRPGLRRNAFAQSARKCKAFAPRTRMKRCSEPRSARQRYAGLLGDAVRSKTLRRRCSKAFENVAQALLGAAEALEDATQALLGRCICCISAPPELQSARKPCAGN